MVDATPTPLNSTRSPCSSSVAYASPPGTVSSTAFTTRCRTPAAQVASPSPCAWPDSVSATTAGPARDGRQDGVVVPEQAHGGGGVGVQGLVDGEDDAVAGRRGARERALQPRQLFLPHPAPKRDKAPVDADQAVGRVLVGVGVARREEGGGRGVARVGRGPAEEGDVVAVQHDEAPPGTQSILIVRVVARCRRRGDAQARVQVRAADGGQTVVAHARVHARVGAAAGQAGEHTVEQGAGRGGRGAGLGVEHVALGKKEGRVGCRASAPPRPDLQATRLLEHATAALSPPPTTRLQSHAPGAARGAPPPAATRPPPALRRQMRPGNSAGGRGRRRRLGCRPLGHPRTRPRAAGRPRPRRRTRRGWMGACGRRAGGAWPSGGSRHAAYAADRALSLDHTRTRHRRGGRHPAASASAAVQKKRSPGRLMRTESYRRSPCEK